MSAGRWSSTCAPRHRPDASAMHCLVVIAHPLEDSLCQSLAQEAIRTLTAAGHAVQVEDLCRTGFAPALTAAERRSYYGPAFDGGAVQAQIDRLLLAEALVLVFPTWWFGFPAVLKGWFDRMGARRGLRPCKRPGAHPPPPAPAAQDTGHHHIGVALVGGPAGAAPACAARAQDRAAGHLRATQCLRHALALRRRAPVRRPGAAVQRAHRTRAVFMGLAG